jgi:putative transcriptional regulator
MARTKAYTSPVSASLHELAADLHDAGVLDKATMRRFDARCLTPIRVFTAEEIRSLREREQVSQAVFAAHLNVSKDAVSQWERGQKQPAGPSLKLLSLIERKGLDAIA